MRQRCSTCSCNLPVLEGTDPADAKPAHDMVSQKQWHTAFRGDHTGQSQMDEATALYRIFRILGRAMECSGGVRLHDCSVDAPELGIVATLEIEQVATVVHDSDHHLPVVCERLSLGG